MQNKEHVPNEVSAIVNQLIDDTTSEQIELVMLIESLSDKLNRRQALILRILLMNSKISQTTISKILGYSASTINIDIQKIKEVVVKLYKHEGKDYSKLLKRLK